MKKFTFRSQVTGAKVTVKSEWEHQACTLAAAELNRRARKAGKSAPYKWELLLVEVHPIEPEETAS